MPGRKSDLLCEALGKGKGWDFILFATGLNTNSMGFLLMFATGLNTNSMGFLLMFATGLNTTSQG